LRYEYLTAAMTVTTLTGGANCNPDESNVIVEIYIIVVGVEDAFCRLTN
jgi:hypothetical protein